VPRAAFAQAQRSRLLVGCPGCRLGQQPLHLLPGPLALGPRPRPSAPGPIPRPPAPSLNPRYSVPVPQPPVPSLSPVPRRSIAALTARVRPERHQHEVVREPRHGEGREAARGARAGSAARGLEGGALMARRRPWAAHPGHPGPASPRRWPGLPPPSSQPAGPPGSTVRLRAAPRLRGRGPGRRAFIGSPSRGRVHRQMPRPPPPAQGRGTAPWADDADGGSDGSAALTRLRRELPEALSCTGADLVVWKLAPGQKGLGSDQWEIPVLEFGVGPPGSRAVGLKQIGESQTLPTRTSKLKDREGRGQGHRPKSCQPSMRKRESAQPCFRAPSQRTVRPAWEARYSGVRHPTRPHPCAACLAVKSRCSENVGHLPRRPSLPGWARETHEPRTEHARRVLDATPEAKRQGWAC
jgi:hypothetical protein